MGRTPYQVLVIPYYLRASGRPEFAVFKRADSGYWQEIAGGGEEGETPTETAKREAWEEAGIGKDSDFILLDAIFSVPVTNFEEAFFWGEEVLVIPIYTFGVEVKTKNIELSSEHLECRWVDYDKAIEMLKWDSDKTALWELNQRIQRQLSGK